LPPALALPDRVLVQAQRVAYELVSSGNNKGSGTKAARVELIPA
jgi:hypothetical protein